MQTTAHQGLPQKHMHPCGNFIRSNRAPMPATICSMPSGNVGCARAPRTANVQQATALRYPRKPCISQLIYTTNKKQPKAGQGLLNCEKEHRSTVRAGRLHEALPGSALAEKVNRPRRTIESAEAYSLRQTEADAIHTSRPNGPQSGHSHGDAGNAITT